MRSYWERNSTEGRNLFFDNFPMFYICESIALLLKNVLPLLLDWRDDLIQHFFKLPAAVVFLFLKLSMKCFEVWNRTLGIIGSAWISVKEK